MSTTAYALRSFKPILANPKVSRRSRKTTLAAKQAKIAIAQQQRVDDLTRRYIGYENFIRSIPVSRTRPLPLWMGVLCYFTPFLLMNLPVVQKASAQSPPQNKNLERLTHDAAVEVLGGWSPDGNKIIYAEEQGAAGFDLFAINKAGGVPQKLTDLPGDEYVVKFNPLGDKIVFENTPVNGVPEKPALYLADADGNNLEEIAAGFDSPSLIGWNFNGQKIAFLNGTDLYVYDAASKTTALLESDISQALWSPAQDKIIFTKSSGDPAQDWLVKDLLAGETKPLVNGAVRILLAKDGSAYYTPATEDNSLYKIDLAGATKVASLDSVIESAKLSPDGKNLALGSADGLYLAGADGKNLRKITSISGTPIWSPKSDLVAILSDGLYVVDKTGDVVLELKPSKLFMAGWSPVENLLAMQADMGDGNTDLHTWDGGSVVIWTDAQLAKIQKYAPVIIQDGRPDTTKTAVYLPTNPHADDIDVADNHENYDADAAQFHPDGKNVAYAKVTEYRSLGYDVYTYIYYRADNPHWCGIKAFEHEHDVQRVHVKVDRATGKATEVAYSQHNWMAKHQIKDSSGFVLFSEWGGHEYWKFIWPGADGKGQKLDSSNTEFRPLERIVSDVDVDKDGRYRTDEAHLPTSPPPKGPWLYKDVLDPKSAFDTWVGKAGAFCATLHSPGELSVIVNGKTTSRDKIEIPNSAWQNNSVGVLELDKGDSLTLRVVGTEKGKYSLESALAADKPYFIASTEIPIKKGEVHTYKLNQAGIVTLIVQKDGQKYVGNFEKNITATDYKNLVSKEQNPLLGYVLELGGIGAIAVAAGHFLMRWRKQEKQKAVWKAQLEAEQMYADQEFRGLQSGQDQNMYARGRNP